MAHKYHARPAHHDGYRFDSQAEYRQYLALQLRERAGEITDLRVHPRYLLFRKANGQRAITYVGDFEYREGERLVCEDVKGVQTPVFRLKANLFARVYPDVELRIVQVGAGRLSARQAGR